MFFVRASLARVGNPCHGRRRAAFNTGPILMRHFVLLVAVVFATSIANAQPAPQLGGVTPIYLKQGQSLDVTLGGSNLGGASQVFLTDAAGLSAELITDKAADPKKPVNAVKVKLTATADADLGVRELRVATSNGVTRPIAPRTTARLCDTAIPAVSAISAGIRATAPRRGRSDAATNTARTIAVVTIEVA